MMEAERLRVGQHVCPRPGCTKHVPDEMFACRSHWFSLTADLRSAIWRAYADGTGVGSDALLAAHAAAIDYWEDRDRV